MSMIEDAIDVEPEKVEESSTTVEEKRTKELESAQVELEREERELVDVVGEAIGAFGKELSSSGTDEEAWRRWWVEGWAREFCRSVSLFSCWGGFFFWRVRKSKAEVV